MTFCIGPEDGGEVGWKKHCPEHSTVDCPVPFIGKYRKTDIIDRASSSVQLAPSLPKELEVYCDKGKKLICVENTCHDSDQCK